MPELTTDDGSDPTDAILSALDQEAKELAIDAMDVWFAEAQDRLVEAAQQRAGGEGPDDSEGKEYRRQNNLADMLDEFQPPQVTGDAELAFSWTHAAAVFHEFGATPHEIRAKEAQTLAFEWPDAPQEIRDQFSATFPLVFFDSVEHPGTPAIAPIRYGRDKARERLERGGVDTDVFEKGGQ